MTTAEHLETIDRLLAQEFPREPVRTVDSSGGPGFHLVRLSRTRHFWDDDGSGRIEAADQISAEYGAITQAMTDRWGEPQVFSLGTVLERGFEGEGIEEPWSELSNCTDHVHLWRAGERWLVVCVAQWDRDDPYLLTAGVTVVDPP
ncbi:hypothetical protein [Streptomyces sp. NRRL S-378]|uniref:hypothetical protein n=1 Tax=Streptomyces sp. NRRL S-378 TaxID=1463904 RepID=UPI0004C75FBF|nr:hypothetical protein [Streptomyces sp. NRRL S-378]